MDSQALSPKRSAGVERFELLIRLLKLGTFINAPMKAGVCDLSGLSQVEIKIIMALAGEGAMAGHELVWMIGITPMNVSRAIAALRAAGLVEDAIDPGNRRRKPVRLTEAGHAAYARITPLLEGVADALLSGLTARQRREFASLADQIVSAMAGWIAQHEQD